MLIESLIGIFAPVAVEGIKQAATRWFGGVKPTTVDEQIKLDNNEIEKLKAIAALDNPVGTPSQWVVDLRASSRYIGALAVIGVGIGSIYIPSLDVAVKTIALEAANIAFGFLFGTRIVANFKK